MSKVGKNIRQLRGLNGLSQEELSKLIFVSRQTVSNYETGKSKPDIDMLVSISEVFDTDVNELIYGISSLVDQKDKVKVLIRFVVVCILLVISVYYYDSFAKAMGRYSVAAPRILVKNTLWPSLYLLVGWNSMSLVNVILGTKPLSGKVSRLLYYTLILITIIYFVIITPFLLAVIKSMFEVLMLERKGGGYSYSFNFVFVPVWDRIASKLFLYFGKYHFIFVLIGGVLWATKPKKKEKLSI